MPRAAAKAKSRTTGAPTASASRATRAKKISITVDEGVLRDVAKDAERAGRTLSAHVTEALARDVRRRRLHALIEEYEAAHGSIGDDELARVRAAWQA